MEVVQALVGNIKAKISSVQMNTLKRRLGSHIFIQVPSSQADFAFDKEEFPTSITRFVSFQMTDLAPHSLVDDHLAPFPLSPLRD